MGYDGGAMSRWFLCGSAYQHFLNGLTYRRAGCGNPLTLAETDVCDHRHVDVAMASQFLDGSNIRAALEEVCGKRMPEGMARGSFRETGHHHGIPDGFLSVNTHAGSQVVA